MNLHEILGNEEKMNDVYTIVIVVLLIVEAWLGKTPRVKSGSLLEAIARGLKLPTALQHLLPKKVKPKTRRKKKKPTV
jgi:hypothetical protein